ncbi:MAG: hypothetical protein E6G03_10760 [Actinobacteria bacterium]|nr:MAG: hypothetical protein E6G03_10760 [Actinomycetota bacterium]
MASWVLTEQVVWISARATGFTIVCERCAETADDFPDNFPSIQGTLSLDHLRGTIECPRGHQVRVERDGR